MPIALEISRSGNGAHVWIFFAVPVSARDARRLGTATAAHANSMIPFEFRREKLAGIGTKFGIGSVSNSESGALRKTA